jgi:DNA repair exonuclease SbcCD ATPase subunit
MSSPCQHQSPEDQVAELEGELTRLRSKVRPWSDKLAGETIKEQLKTIDALRLELAKLKKEREEYFRIAENVFDAFKRISFSERQMETDEYYTCDHELGRLEELYNYGPN